MPAPKQRTKRKTTRPPRKQVISKKSRDYLATALKGGAAVGGTVALLHQLVRAEKAIANRNRERSRAINYEANAARAVASAQGNKAALDSIREHFRLHPELAPDVQALLKNPNRAVSQAVLVQNLQNQVKAIAEGLRFLALREPVLLNGIQAVLKHYTAGDLKTNADKRVGQTVQNILYGWSWYRWASPLLTLTVLSGIAGWRIQKFMRSPPLNWPDVARLTKGQLQEVLVIVRENAGLIDAVLTGKQLIKTQGDQFDTLISRILITLNRDQLQVLTQRVNSVYKRVGEVLHAQAPQFFPSSKSEDVKPKNVKVKVEPNANKRPSSSR